MKLAAPERKAVLSALGERDPEAAMCLDSKGNPEPDPDLRDTETMPLSEDVDAYIAREVLPHVPDAWVDPEQDEGRLRDPAEPTFLCVRAPASARRDRGGLAGAGAGDRGPAVGGDGVRALDAAAVKLSLVAEFPDRPPIVVTGIRCAR